MNILRERKYVRPITSNYAISGDEKLVERFKDKFNSDEAYRETILLKLYPNHKEQKVKNHIASSAYHVAENEKDPLVVFTAIYEEDKERYEQLKNMTIEYDNVTFTYWYPNNDDLE